MPAGEPSSPAAPSGFTGREALQALLAFSSLHEQIRQRRIREKLHGGRLPGQDEWQLEQFVLDEVLQLVAERALAVTGADGIAVALAEGDAIVCRASAGTIAPDAGMRLDPNEGFSGECLVSGRVVRCDDTETDLRVDRSACQRLGVRSMVAIPLSAKQRVVGLVEAFSSEPYGFNDSDVRSLNLLAELILSAMRPEEEDRLAEISQRVIHVEVVEPEPAEPVQEISQLDERQEASVVSVQPGPLAVSESGSSAPVSKPIPKPISKNSSAAETAVIPMQEYASVDRSRPGVGLVAALVLLAALLGSGVWWKLGHQVRSASASPHTVAPAPQVSRPQNSIIVAPTEQPAPAALLDDDSDTPAPRTPEEAGLLPEVMGIRHWSSGDSSTVVIDLKDQVQYEAHRLPNPERIYFDLYDTKLVQQLANRIIVVDDALVQRVRIAQPMPSVTRVVLETKGLPDYSVSLESNPYRLVVEVRKVGSKSSARAKVDLFAPVNPKPEAPAAPLPQPSPGTPAVSEKLEKLPVASTTPVGTEENHLLARGSKLRVVLDAGHGGWDLGTVGRKGLLEKDLVLDIVERAGKLMEDRLGAEVIYTRKDDNYLALEKRAEIANLAQAQLFVSVHANYSDFPSARGVETYYSNTYSSVKARTEEADENSALHNIDWTKVDIREKVHESRRIAASVQRALYGMLASKNPGLPNRGVKEAHYVVLTGTSMPAVLAEVSFVSSPTDENNLQSSTYRQRIAEALYSGIAGYEASNRPVKIASAAKVTAR